MRVRAIVVTVAALLLVLVTGAPAQAKGADRVTITGPGLAHPIVVGGDGEPGSGGDLGQFSEGSGMFVAVLGTDSEQGLSTEPPAGPLGPKYDLAYGFPGVVEQVVHQDLYPSAPGGPVTYTAAGQSSVFGSTRGGWYQSSVEFARLLVKLGVPGVTVLGQAPASPPATTVAAAPVADSGDSGGSTWWWLAVVGLVLVAAGGLGWALRRRRQASTA